MCRVGRQQPFEHYWHDEVEVSSWRTQGLAVVLQLELCSGTCCIINTTTSAPGEMRLK